MDNIASIILKCKFDLSSEQRLKDQMEDAFQYFNVDYKREFRLDNSSILDFYIPVVNIAIEVKIKGSPMAIYKQCARYCEYDQVSELYLVTNKFMNLPEKIKDKPARTISLGRGWL